MRLLLSCIINVTSRLPLTFLPCWDNREVSTTTLHTLSFTVQWSWLWWPETIADNLAVAINAPSVSRLNISTSRHVLGAHLVVGSLMTFITDTNTTPYYNDKGSILPWHLKFWQYTATNNALVQQHEQTMLFAIYLVSPRGVFHFLCAWFDAWQSTGTCGCTIRQILISQLLATTQHHPGPVYQWRHAVRYCMLTWKKPG